MASSGGAQLWSEVSCGGVHRGGVQSEALSGGAQRWWAVEGVAKWDEQQQHIHRVVEYTATVCG